MTRAKTAKKVDGRRARAVRTHKAIVEAILDLIDQGNLEPTAQEVADRAGVALRSIRQHFESREALLIAAASAHAARAEPAEPIDPTLPFEGKLGAFVKTRAQELERTSAIRRSASIVEHKSAAIAAILRSTIRRRRQEVATVFARELDALPAAAKKAALETLDLATSGRAWDYARRDMGLGIEDSVRLVQRSMAVALGKPLPLH